jgi:hypothetical protein
VAVREICGCVQRLYELRRGLHLQE